jgi:Zn-dependent protease
MIELALVVACFAFFFLSIVAHEVAHGWVAWRCGDPTARDLGRLSFNPLVHVDPVFSIVVPIVTYMTLGFPFGGAKPVPVVVQNLRDPKLDDIKVTAAGPMTNFAIAGVFALLMYVPFFGERTADNGAMILMGVTVYVNLFLGLFNLLPVPPLDGSHIVAHFLPEPIRSSYRAIGSIGILILLALLVGVPEVARGLFAVIDGVWALFGHSREFLAEILARFWTLREGLF